MIRVRRGGPQPRIRDCRGGLRPPCVPGGHALVSPSNGVFSWVLNAFRNVDDGERYALAGRPQAAPTIRRAACGRPCNSLGGTWPCIREGDDGRDSEAFLFPAASRTTLVVVT